MAVVTISRQLGALGEEVARALAERLDYQLVDRDKLIKAAQAYTGLEVSSGVPEIAEKRPSFWERLNEERHRYRVVLRSALLEFAEQDRAVLLGVGGAFMLHDYSHTLRVLTVSPMSVRVERVMRTGTPERPGPLDREAAMEAIRENDRERAGHVRYLYNADWVDPGRYDLVLNTGRLSVGQAVEVLAAAVERLNLSLTPESADRLHNAALGSRVEATLLSNGGVWVHGLQAVADGSVIHLNGEVIAEEDRELAEEITLQVPGVTRVINDLRIQPPPLTGM